jgi:hypothetical protein
VKKKKQKTPNLPASTKDPRPQVTTAMVGHTPAKEHQKAAFQFKAHDRSKSAGRENAPTKEIYSKVVKIYSSSWYVLMFSKLSSLSLFDGAMLTAAVKGQQ